MKVNILEFKYNKLVRQVLKTGVINKNRNGLTRSIFFKTLTFNGANKPLLTQRKIYDSQAYGEFQTFIKEKKITNVKQFEKYGCKYWRPWAKKNGDISLDYGNLWNNFNGYNQVKELEKNLKSGNNNRRLIINSWKPDNLKKLTLPCCHFLYQFYIRDGKLDMIWYQRSLDVLIGLPYDMLVAYYMLEYFSQKANLKQGKINMVFGDVHIYENQIDKIKLNFFWITNSKKYKYKNIIKYNVN